MAWGDDDTGFGDSFGDAFGEGYGEDQGAYSGDSYGEATGGYGDISGENMGEALGYDTSTLGDLGSYLSPEDYSFNAANLFDKPALENLESYYSTPTQIGYSAPLSSLAGTFGYTPGMQQEISPEIANVKAMLAKPDTTGMSWDQAQEVREQMENLGPVQNISPERWQERVTRAYEANPLTTLARYGTTAGTLGAMVNPALGLLGPVSSALDYGLRSYYGQPKSAVGLGGSIGSALGAGAGPVGAVLGGSLGKAAAAGYEGIPAGETFGKSLGTGVSGMLGSLVGGATAGPLGAKIGNLGMGELAKLAMNAQSIRNQTQQMKDIRETEGRQREYSNQLADLIANPERFQNTPMFQSQRRQALQEGLRGLSAAGKLGSGARAYAMGEAASDIANRYYGQEATRLANLAGTATERAQLARLKSQAQGARNYALINSLADLGLV